MSAISLLWRRDGPTGERLILTFVLTVTIAAGLAWQSVRAARPLVLGKGEFLLVNGLSASHDRFELVGLRSDGQFFLAVARDPSLSRPGVFALGNVEAAYRAQRPLMSYAAWLLGGGQRGAIAVAIQVVSILAAGLAAVAVARLPGVIERWRPVYALGLIVAGWSTVVFCTSEMLALALVAAGVRLWRPEEPSERRVGPAVLCFALAGLTRETMLLVPLALLAWGVVTRRRPGLRQEAALACSVVPYVLWSVVVRVRYHAWGQRGHPGNFGLPFAGLVHTAPHWDPTSVWFAVAAGLLAVVACWQWRTPYGFIALAYGLFAVMLGNLVWGSWLNSSRVLLPLTVFSLMALLTRTRAPGEAPTAVPPEEGSLLVR